MLSQKQRLFVEAYAGNIPEAMRVAGYQGADNYLEQKGKELLQDPTIVEAIKERSRYMAKTKNAIANREERQEFWTNIMRNKDPLAKAQVDPITNAPLPEENIPLPTRLKASEMLGKSEADFIDKVEMSNTVTLLDVIKQSYLPAGKEDLSLEAIEAEYHLLKEQNQLPKMPDHKIDASDQNLATLVEDLI